MRTVLGAMMLAGLLVGPARAQTGGVAAQCAPMKDPIGCTCALATGGTVSGTTWSRGRGDDRQAYEACLTERGRPPVRAQQIPGRM
jgi:hypothetical protein